MQNAKLNSTPTYLCNGRFSLLNTVLPSFNGPVIIGPLKSGSAYNKMKGEVCTKRYAISNVWYLRLISHTRREFVVV